MQKLHLVGVNLTRDGLIFSDRRGTGGRSFVVPIDPVLASLVAELAADGGVSGEVPEPIARPESALSVREIQARLRGGRSIDEIAEAAGVPAGWIERFAPPIRAEQARIIDRARTSTLERARLGPSEEPLGRAVAHNLATKGVRLSPQEFDGGWSAHQRIDGRWVVEHAYTQRGRGHTATWEFDEDMEGLVAADRRSLEVGYVAPGAERPARTSTVAESAVPRTEPEGGRRTPTESTAPAEPARPARVGPAAEVEPWSEALDWLALNDEEGQPGREDLSLGLLRLIEQTPAAGTQGTASPTAASGEAEPPGWVSGGDEGSPASGGEPDVGEPEVSVPAARPDERGPEVDDHDPVDPLGFLAAVDESGVGSRGPATIRADRVASEAPETPEASGEPGGEGPTPPPPARERHPQSPRRRNRPLRAR